MCYSHYEAMPMLKEFWERGIRVPGQMSMVAFNDVFPMDCTVPPITTVSVPADEIGAEAARVLLRQLEDGAQAPPSAKVFAESLMIRRSCAAPGEGAA
jgi:LacI family transcriptional regulator